MHNVPRRVVTCVMFVTLVLTCHSAPSARENEEPLYDQRQQGDVNVHVRLEDIGILAFMDESLLSGIGQYDYSYDYEDPSDPVEEGSDKPNESSTSTSSSVSTTETSDLAASSFDSSISPNASAPTTVANDETNGTQESTTVTQEIKENSTLTANVTVNDNAGTSTLPPKPRPKDKSTTENTPQSSETTSSEKPSHNTPENGIQEVANNIKGNVPTSKPLSSTAAVSPASQTQGGLKYHRGSVRRRCSAGYFKDSRGRCRRHRQPSYNPLQRLHIELPFGIRLAPRRELPATTDT